MKLKIAFSWLVGGRTLISSNAWWYETQQDVNLDNPNVDVHKVNMRKKALISTKSADSCTTFPINDNNSWATNVQALTKYWQMHVLSKLV